MDGQQGLEHGPSFLQPSELSRRLDHAVLPTHLKGRNRPVEGLACRMDDVQIRQRRLNHHDVGPLLDVQLNLPKRLTQVGWVHLIGLAVPKLRAGVHRLPKRCVQTRGKLGGIREDRHMEKASPSSAWRIARTPPSIRSECATMSAPARPWLSANLYR